LKFSNQFIYSTAAGAGGKRQALFFKPCVAPAARLKKMCLTVRWQIGFAEIIYQVFICHLVVVGF